MENKEIKLKPILEYIEENFNPKQTLKEWQYNQLLSVAERLENE